MREIKLHMKVTATAASSRSAGPSIILGQGTESCPCSGTCNCGGGRSLLARTAGCGCYGPTDSQL